MSDIDIDYNEDVESDVFDEPEEIEMNEKLYLSIKETFDEEVFKILKKVSEKYGKEYLFTYDDLVKFYKEYDIKIMYHKAPIKKESNIERTIPEEERCCARIWANGFMDVKKKQYGNRCQRKKTNNSDFCRQHYINATHGRYDEEPSKIVKGFYIKESQKNLSSDD
jgi:hypothetical protein